MSRSISTAKRHSVMGDKQVMLSKSKDTIVSWEKRTCSFSTHVRAKMKRVKQSRPLI